MEPNLGELKNAFYRLLLRIFVIQCAWRAQKRQFKTDVEPRRILATPRQPWQIFLDCLCTLCDAGNGGSTTTSIAVEQTRLGSIFWIATNLESNSKARFPASEKGLQAARELLERTLQALAGLHANPDAASAVQNAIYVDSIELCRKRISHYRGYAIRFMKAIRETTENPPRITQLIDRLEELFKPDKPDRDICKDVYDFCRSERGDLLRSEAVIDSFTWRRLRHNVGRLACWYKSTLYLVDAAPLFTDALTGFHVKRVPQRQVRNQQALFPDSLAKLFSDVDAEDYDISLSRLTAVFGDSAMIQVKDDLCAFLRTPSDLKLHAEIQVADFFYTSGRSYFRNTRYVGCSKGTCYCCDLYLSLHPADLVRRPTHENAWVKWQLSDVVLDGDAGVALLERMILRMKADVRRLLINGGHRGHAKTLDSSTGMVSFARLD